MSERYHSTTTDGIAGHREYWPPREINQSTAYCRQAWGRKLFVKGGHSHVYCISDIRFGVAGKLRHMLPVDKRHGIDLTYKGRWWFAWDFRDVCFPEAVTIKDWERYVEPVYKAADMNQYSVVSKDDQKRTA